MIPTTSTPRCARGRAAVSAASAVLALATVVIGLTGCRSIQSNPEQPGFRVTPGVAFEMATDAADMPILDLRAPEEFDGSLGHLQRARNVPLEELPQRLPELLWLHDQTFLIYCRGTDECGEEAIRFFLSQGFEDAVLLDGGIEKWRAEGFVTVGPGSEDPEMEGPVNSGLRLPPDARGIGKPRYLPKPP